MVLRPWRHQCRQPAHAARDCAWQCAPGPRAGCTSESMHALRALMTHSIEILALFSFFFANRRGSAWIGVATRPTAHDRPAQHTRPQKADAAASSSTARGTVARPETRASPAMGGMSPPIPAPPCPRRATASLLTAAYPCHTVTRNGSPAPAGAVVLQPCACTASRYRGLVDHRVSSPPSTWHGGVDTLWSARH